MEAALLGGFMFSACSFGVLLEFPNSPLHQLIPDATLRRILMGLAMGLTAVALIASPWGQQSGAHMNPAVSIAYWRLGRVRGVQAVCYALFQALGAICGVGVARALLGLALADPAVHYVATLPGRSGPTAAFVAELLISALLFTTVLVVSASRWAGQTRWFAGALIAVSIAVEAPVSGMSMNPARTLGSAVWASDWTAFWIYLVAPTLGMLLASELFQRLRGVAAVHCAKLNHQTKRRCIFCGFGMAEATNDSRAA